MYSRLNEDQGGNPGVLKMVTTSGMVQHPTNTPMLLCSGLARKFVVTLDFHHLTGLSSRICGFQEKAIYTASIKDALFS
jgi:hypothetical protein